VEGQAPHARQAEMRLPHVLPLQLPREDVVFIRHVSLQAILVLDSPDVDIGLWNAMVTEMEASGKLGCDTPHAPMALPLRMSGRG